MAGMTIAERDANIRKTQQFLDALKDPSSRRFWELSNGMAVLLNTQYWVSGHVEGALPNAAVDGISREMVATYALAMVDEVMELAREFVWKPWKPQVQVDKTRAVDEFADILAFLGVWLNYLEYIGVTMDDVAAAYARKSQLNFDRFMGKVDGYKMEDK